MAIETELGLERRGFGRRWHVVRALETIRGLDNFSSCRTRLFSTFALAFLCMAASCSVALAGHNEAADDLSRLSKRLDAVSRFD